MTSKATPIAAALGLVSLLTILVSAGVGYRFVEFQRADFIVLFALGVLGMFLQLRSLPISRYGYVSLAFFVGFTGLAYNHKILHGTAITEWYQQLSMGVLVLAFAMIPRLMETDVLHKAVFYGVNLIRLVVVGCAYLLTQRALPDPDTFSVYTVAAATVAALAYYFFDKLVVGFLIEEFEEESDKRIWANIQARAGKLLPSQVYLALLSMAFASVASTSGNSPWICILLGVGVAALPALVLHSALYAAIEELVVEDQEQIKLHLKTEQHRNKTLKDLNEGLESDLQKQSKELEIIYDMARSLGASTNLAETMGIVQSMIRRLRIPYASCVIFLLREGGALYPALADTPYKEVLEMSPLLQLQEHLILRVLQDQRPQMVPEMAASSEQRIFKDERSVLCVPLIVSKENVGVIYLGSTNPKTHREEHLEKLKMLAAYAAPSIKTALLFQDKEEDLHGVRQALRAVEAKNRQLAGLQKLGQAIGASLKIDNTLRVVTENLQQMIPSSQSVIIFASSPDDMHSLRAEYAQSPYADFIKTLPVRSDEGLLGKATELNSTLLVQDTHVYDLQNIINYERCVIVAPLTAENDVLGCLYVGAQKENSFTEEHRSLVETVSYQAAIAIKNARLFDQTQQMALTDGLTGLYTHRFFQVRLSEEIEWSERSGKPICLVMVDTDHFKSYNDNLGHPAGDGLLKEIASLLRDKVRNTDIVCRYGGDEFALILKDAPKDQAILTCERIRETFQLRFAAASVQVTASIGISCYPTDARNKKELAKAADDAMYMSKKGGRNRVTGAPTLEEKKHLAEIVQETLPR